MKKLEFVGVWWPADNPENRIGGVLKFEQPDWPRLELIGAFESTFSNPRKFHEIILGLSTDGKAITLKGCQETSRTFATIGVESTSYSSIFVFVGKHFDNDGDMKFAKARLDLTHLFEWIGYSAIEQNYEASPNRSIRLAHSIPDEIEFPTSRGSYCCKFGAGTRHDGKAHTLEESRWIEIKAKRARPIQTFLHDLIQPFQHFLSLGTGEPTFIEELIFEMPGDATAYVEVYFAQRSYRQAKKRLSCVDMLFSLRDVYPRKERVLNTWLRATEKMREVRLLFHDVERTPDMFLHHKFLSIVQALETYHSRRFKSEIIPRSEHKSRLRKIRNACPKEHREWISDRLGNSNSKTLRMRLAELMARYRELLTPIIVDFEWFNQKVRDTRNYFTHYNPAVQKNALDGVALLWNVERLTVLLKACLLKDLGLNVALATNLFRDLPTYTHLTTIRDYHGSDR